MPLHICRNFAGEARAGWDRGRNDPAAFLQTSTFADEIVAALTDEISNALAHSHENRHDG